MPEAWDTTVASRAAGRHAPLLEAHLSAGAPIAIPAPTVQEIIHGLHTRMLRNGDAGTRLNWFLGLLAHSLVTVVPLATNGALIAGRLLATLPHPPTGPRRRSGTRAQQRAAWALDVQIAACAFAGGYGVLTENVADFGLLRDAIAQLVPGVPPLVVSDARELATSA